jgi:hypothetical protein
MPGPFHPDTEARLAELQLFKGMIAEGLSQREMARRLGVTKNTVSGKLWRLGLKTGNPQPAGLRHAKPRPPKELQQHIAARRLALAREQNKHLNKTGAKTVFAIRPGFDGRAPRACQWPEGEGAARLSADDTTRRNPAGEPRASHARDGRASRPSSQPRGGPMSTLEQTENSWPRRRAPMSAASTAPSASA